VSGEFDRIRKIAQALGPRAGGLLDDCALLQAGEGHLVVSTDSSVEGVHFRLDWLRHREVGWRAAASALSDLAAEGATPAAVLAAIVVPLSASDADLEEVMEGVGAAAAAVDALVAGGDLSRGPAWIATMTVLGWTKHAITRAGARPGDGLWVTGALGGARAALEAWKRGGEPGTDARTAFAHPLPRIDAGRRLARAGARAMLDLSDGLGGDARHLAEASGVAVELEVDAVPVASSCLEEARRIGISPQQFAAEGGEDFELLAALPSEFGVENAMAFQRESGIALTRVGTVRAGLGIRATSAGRALALEGFDHFR
jgi:thiamine-monophosphate kinase